MASGSVRQGPAYVRAVLRLRTWPMSSSDRRLSLERFVSISIRLLAPCQLPILDATTLHYMRDGRPVRLDESHEVEYPLRRKIDKAIK
jgi:hypothetical protein